MTANRVTTSDRVTADRVTAVTFSLTSQNKREHIRLCSSRMSSVQLNIHPEDRNTSNMFLGKRVQNKPFVLVAIVRIISW